MAEWSKALRSGRSLVLQAWVQYISYIVAVSFIGGEKRNTRRKPLKCRKSLTNLTT
jgi:hypothetical protein